MGKAFEISGRRLLFHLSELQFVPFKGAVIILADFLSPYSRNYSSGKAERF
jgi:hypothetical protein